MPVRRGVCQDQLGEVSVLVGGVFWEDQGQGESVVALSVPLSYV